jgi:2-oxo-4-hydroxy-4-carboxy-5-ureidoimidazoline decarboxylase
MTGRSGAQGGTAGAGLLARFNDLPPDMAFDELLSCCASTTWAAAVCARRPYSSAEAGLRVSDEVVAKLTQPDLAEALSGHPRIGDVDAGQAGGQSPAGPSARSAAWSRREQSGVRTADAATMRSLAELNREYERRFDHIYLVCAAGRSAGELADVLRQRLGNDAGTEWLVVRSELQKINRIRLGDLLGGAG